MTLKLLSGHTRENDTRKLVVLSFMTLDGVMQAPGGPEEDPTGWFKHGGWVTGYFDDFLGKVMDGKMSISFIFKLEGQEFMALNSGPEFKFNEAISLIVDCKTQAEVDRLWEKLSRGGDEKAQICGWLKDKYSLSWQIVPTVLGEMPFDFYLIIRLS